MSLTIVEQLAEQASRDCKVLSAQQRSLSFYSGPRRELVLVQIKARTASVLRAAVAVEHLLTKENKARAQA